jgi:hypothetical protein
MKIIVCNYIYYFKTMAQEVSSATMAQATMDEVDKMFTRLKAAAKQKLLDRRFESVELTPKKIETISDDFMGDCIKHLCCNIQNWRSNKQSVQRTHLIVFENECIKSIEEELLKLL